VIAYRLSWRVATSGGVLLPELFTLSADAGDAEAVRALARRVAAQAYGGEFRLVRDDHVVDTSWVELEAWRPEFSVMPRTLTETTWARDGNRESAIADVKVALRNVLERAAEKGLLSADEALGLRRAAELMMAGRKAA
jgi:hypothetical protein